MSKQQTPTNRYEVTTWNEIAGVEQVLVVRATSEEAAAKAVASLTYHGLPIYTVEKVVEV